MQFRIADTFTESLAKLTGDEQKAVKTTAFDLQLDPANPGMQFHRLDKAKDPDFWSVRVSKDIRLIVHQTASSLLLCYVDHHDEAYRWAERRRLETHPKTGAAQLVEVRETVVEVIVPQYVPEESPSPTGPPLSERITEEELLTYGVPPDWVEEVLRATEDTVLDVVDHLPAEAAEAVLDLAVGVTPPLPQPAPEGAEAFDHPDAQRRFRVVDNVEELSLALDYPWEKWIIFLHPEQRRLVERAYNGPARVSGSAGTGKTIVALHRAVFLARSNPEARVLLATFSDALANALLARLRRLISSDPKLGERIEVHAMNAIGRRLYESNFGPLKIASPEHIRGLLAEALHENAESEFSPGFLWAEWEQVVDAWQLDTWEAYRDVVRLGRKRQLPEARRAVLWSLFARVKTRLLEQGLITLADMFSRLGAHFAQAKHAPFEFVVIDEAQDISVSQLRFLAGVGGDRSNGLFFAGDLGQRIFQQPFSWKALGVDIRGRSSTLRVNYRTSHQIRMRADRLLSAQIADVDGNVEDRRGTVSVFNGPEPVIRILDSQQDEIEVVGEWLAERADEGVEPHEIGVFVRSAADLDRAGAAVADAGLLSRVLDEDVATVSGRVSISTMHLAKGLEFRAVVVMACDDEVIPSMERIAAVADESDLEEVYNTERHLLYVACTRARDYLLVTGVEPASEFLEDM